MAQLGKVGRPPRHLQMWSHCVETQTACRPDRGKQIPDTSTNRTLRGAQKTHSHNDTQLTFVFREYYDVAQAGLKLLPARPLQCWVTPTCLCSAGFWPRCQCNSTGIAWPLKQMLLKTLEVCRPWTMVLTLPTTSYKHWRKTDHKFK